MNVGIDSLGKTSAFVDITFIMFIYAYLYFGSLVVLCRWLLEIKEKDEQNSTLSQIFFFFLDFSVDITWKVFRLLYRRPLAPCRQDTLI